MPKYCKTCNLQGHNEEGYKKLHPSLRNYYNKYEERKDTEVTGNTNASDDPTYVGSNMYPPRTLSSRKVVGDPDA